MNTVHLYASGFHHVPHPLDQVGSEVESQFNMVEPERENFLKHRFAGFMPAGIPTSCQAEDHGAK